MLRRMCIGGVTSITNLGAIAADPPQADRAGAEGGRWGPTGAVCGGLSSEGKGLLQRFTSHGLASSIIASLRFQLGLHQVANAAYYYGNKQWYPFKQCHHSVELQTNSLIVAICSCLLRYSSFFMIPPPFFILTRMRQTSELRALILFN